MPWAMDDVPITHQRFTAPVRLGFFAVVIEDTPDITDEAGLFFLVGRAAFSGVAFSEGAAAGSDGVGGGAGGSNERCTWTENAIASFPLSSSVITFVESGFTVLISATLFSWSINWVTS